MLSNEARGYIIGAAFFCFICFILLLIIINHNHNKLINTFHEANQLAVTIVPADILNPNHQYLCFPLDVDNAYPTKSICKIMPTDYIPPAEM